MSTLTRTRAALLHAVVSLCLLAIYLLALALTWYPNPYFCLQSVLKINSLTLVGVGLLGPLLTLYLYKPGKPGLVVDLIVIGVLQLVCLAPGVWFSYLERPAFLVYVGTRMEVVNYQGIDLGKLPDGVAPASPPPLVYAQPASSREENLALVMAYMERGVGLAQFAERYRDYHPHWDEMVSNSLTRRIDTRDQEPLRSRAQAFADDHGYPAEALAFFDINTRDGFDVLVMEVQGAKIVGVLGLDR